jgi:hypothetical protein
MIDLLQTETVPAASQTLTSPKDEQKDEIRPEVTMDSQPLSTSAKLPPFRRAALHFLALLLRATPAHLTDSSSIQSMLPMKRAKVTLSYIASTDEDTVVRVMAQETLDEIKNLGQAMIGI